jgi:hypothetical protein
LFLSSASSIPESDENVVRNKGKANTTTIFPLFYSKSITTFSSILFASRGPGAVASKNISLFNFIFLAILVTQ